MSDLDISPNVARIVRPAATTLDRLVVLDQDPRLDAPLRDAAAIARSSSEAVDITAAVRAMYRAVGIDPTKTRPSSEALLRRIRKGGELPRINNLVDVINWCSLESQLPFGLYDRDRIEGGVTMRLGGPDEEYTGIRKDTVHVQDRLVLADDRGAFGNPTSDSSRTMVTAATTRALVVIFAPVQVPQAVVDRALGATRERVEEYCRQQS